MDKSFDLILTHQAALKNCQQIQGQIALFYKTHPVTMGEMKKNYLQVKVQINNIVKFIKIQTWFQALSFRTKMELILSKS